MEREFWEGRWRQGSTPWHAGEVNPILTEHIDRITDGPSAVLVPLCGKTVDLWWLARRGHRPIGVEMVPEAARAFFDEARVSPLRRGDRRVGGGVEIRVADIFEVSDLGPIDAVWDRGALIALPPAWHRRYVETLERLAPGAPILLSTVHYDTAVMEGPPFSLSPDDIEALYPEAEMLSRADTVEGSQWAEKGHRWFESIAYLVD